MHHNPPPPPKKPITPDIVHWSSPSGQNLADKFDNDAANGDWRDDLLVIVGVLCMLTFFTVLFFAKHLERWDVLFYVGITLAFIGLYVRVLGKKSRG